MTGLNLTNPLIMQKHILSSQTRVSQVVSSHARVSPGWWQTAVFLQRTVSAALETGKSFLRKIRILVTHQASLANLAYPFTCTNKKKYLFVMVYHDWCTNNFLDIILPQNYTKSLPNFCVSTFTLKLYLY